MKQFFTLLGVLLFMCCQNTTNADFVISTYNNKVKSYKNIEYSVTKIDTFSHDWIKNNKGKILIEKRKNDTLLGMSFYAVSHNYNNNYLYDNYKDFDISNKDNNYTVKNSYSISFLGSPGGQLISDVFFGLDSIYKIVKLIDTKKDYQLHYEFEDDTLYNISHIKKTVIIDKQSFLPTKVIMTSVRNDENTSQIFKFDTILLNSKVINSIENYKNLLQDFEPIEVEKPIKASLIGTKFEEEHLPDLWSNTSVSVSDKLPALISFWEVWCSPCIKSLPELNAIQDTYKQKVNVIGITSESPEQVKAMLLSKNIDYTSLKGTNEILDAYGINSFPTYFIVDKDGMIIKEYSLFSNKIEEDIKAL